MATDPTAGASTAAAAGAGAGGAGAPADASPPAPADEEMSALDAAMEKISTREVASKLQEGFETEKSWEDLVIEGTTQRALPEHLIAATIGNDWVHPSQVQVDTIPPAIGNPLLNIRGHAMNGTGKTGAFCLIALAQLDESLIGSDTVQGLIVTPTREVARNAYDTLNSLIRGYNEERSKQGKAVVRVAGIWSSSGKRRGGKRDGSGGVNRTLPAEIVVASPGSLDSCMKKWGRQFLSGTALNGLRVFVVDEADKMVAENSSAIVLQEVDKHAKGAQRLLFSASFRILERNKRAAKVVEKLLQIGKKRSVVNPATGAKQMVALPPPLQLEAPVLTVKKLGMLTCDVTSAVSSGGDPFQAKVQALASLLPAFDASGGTTIVFCNYIKSVAAVRDAIAEAIDAKPGGTSADRIAALTGGSADRDQIVSRFVSGDIPILVATDVVSRGVHVDNLNVVVNFDLPHEQAKGEAPADGSDADVDTWQHRVGRTARAGRRGVAVNFVATPQDRARLESILSHFDYVSEDLPADDIEDATQMIREACTDV